MPLENKSNFVFIAAAAFEFAPLKELIQSRSYFADADFIEIGIGAINSAQTVASRLQDFVGKDVVYLGTAGSFFPFERVQVYRAKTVRWLPTCERHQLSYAVKPEPAQILQNPHTRLTSLPTIDILCSANVSLSDTLPTDVFKDSSAENLELYSCSRQIAPIAHSFTALIALTNAVGKESHLQWLQNFKPAAELTAQVVCERLDQHD